MFSIPKYKSTQIPESPDSGRDSDLDDSGKRSPKQHNRDLKTSNTYLDVTSVGRKPSEENTGIHWTKGIKTQSTFDEENEKLIRKEWMDLVSVLDRLAILVLALGIVASVAVFFFGTERSKEDYSAVMHKQG